MLSIKKLNVKGTSFYLPAGFTVAVLALMLLLGPVGMVEASPISIKLTTDALGLGTTKLNHDKVVAADVSGFYTSGTTGEGSVLLIQTDGLAGPGTITDPLFVTVTAGEHLDVPSTRYPLFNTLNDYQAGIITITEEHSELPDGKKEGLGVKAFTVGTNGLRVFDSDTGRAKIEGSHHVSGGQGDRAASKHDDDPNGAPHEDEDVTFDFNSLFSVNANDIEVLLSDFKDSDLFDLSINFTDGTSTDHLLLGTLAGATIFDKVDPLYNELWVLKFAGLGLSPDALVDRFTIRANIPDGDDYKSHFLITGLTADANPVPIPGAIYLLGSGLLGIVGIRKKFR
ncbi:MAG: hypothetical protein JRI95_11585 [Deltaproteobacteria bacterium]|nr:hypothetical protein [Deltaproteobacteria bacterium]